MLIRRAEIEGRGPVDVRLRGDRVAEIGPDLGRRPGEPELDAAGGALLPGLHDHHVHLFAWAAARASVPCGPPAVRSPASLRGALARARPRGGWVRGVGYHESVAGLLDRAALDAMRPDVPVRVQHRSGSLWMVNSAGAERLGLDRAGPAEGIERDVAGRATGRLYRLDAWLRTRLPGGVPDLRAVGDELARYGVTGVSDATAANGPAELDAFRDALHERALPQRVLVLGTRELPDVPDPDARVARGAVKILLDERRLPQPAELRGRIAAAHASGRPVAVHCVTRAELVLAVVAIEEAGPHPGDRLEHASVVPPDLVPRLAALPVAVVTQPGFVYERGDAYLRDVEPADRPWLYRARALLEAGIPLGGGTDAPFGGADPWRAVRAAVCRRTASGELLGAEERLSPERALALFTSPPEAPGGVPRRVRAGAHADLCLLDRPWADARRILSSDLVAETFCAGARVFGRA